MSKVTIKFTDGHTFSIENTENANIVIDSYIEEYTEANPGVKLELREYEGDKVEEPKSPDAEVTDKVTPSGEDQYHPDSEYLALKHSLFMGLLAFYTEEVLVESFKKPISEYSDADLYGRAKGMSKENLFKYLARADLERSAHFLKYRLGVPFDTPIAEIKEEELLNILGHRGIVTSYNEVQRKWQCVVGLRDGIIIHLADDAVNAGLRGLISRLTGVYYVNNDILDTYVEHWMKVNEVKEDPRRPDSEYLDKLAAECGTSVAEIEADYEKAVAKGLAD